MRQERWMNPASVLSHEQSPSKHSESSSALTPNQIKKGCSELGNLVVGNAFRTPPLTKLMLPLLAYKAIFWELQCA
jgi:hypothetical protein